MPLRKKSSKNRKLNKNKIKKSEKKKLCEYLKNKCKNCKSNSKKLCLCNYKIPKKKKNQPKTLRLF